MLTVGDMGGTKAQFKRALTSKRTAAEVDPRGSKEQA